jgi:hypothetical protein
MKDPPRLSAYLSIFDDWDFLPDVLKSVDSIADEIVVVDGGYDWIAPHLGNRDPARSRDEVYDALAPYSAKTKIIQRTWQDEFEKRRAGFLSCSSRYVMRFDADEINFFDEGALARFFSSGKAVAPIDMPAFLTPAFYHGHSVDGVRQSALFDRARINDRQHLDWLWLVLPKALTQDPVDPELLFHECVAFTPHLTLWRRPFSASTRAMFYVLLWIKNNRGDAALRDIAPEIRELLMGRDVVAGGPYALDTGYVAPSPLSAEQSAPLARLFANHLDALADLNRGLRDGRRVNNGEPYNIDLSSERHVEALGSTLTFSGPIQHLNARLTSVMSVAPFTKTEIVAVSIDGRSARLDIPKGGEAIRRALTVTPRIGAPPVVEMRSS